MQAQDYAGAKWAIGLRLQGITDDDVEQALRDRTIVRTWPMRGTLHFVAPADVHWMLKLLTPRIIERSGLRARELGLDDKTFGVSRKLIANALSGGRQLSRGRMYRLLEDAGISTSGQRGNHILWRLAQEGLICFAAREAKQQAFALLDEWVHPPARSIDHEEALSTLAVRYFGGHGPATTEDFAWWSGLRAGDARRAIELAKRKLAHEVIGGRTYWSPESPLPAQARRPLAHLLPPFDEYLVGYKDRSTALDAALQKHAPNLLSPTIAIDGRVVGTWGRSLRNGAVIIRQHLFGPLAETRRRAIMAAAERYAAFLRQPLADSPPA